MAVRKRHPASAYSRDTHSNSGIDFTAPLHGEYGAPTPPISADVLGPAAAADGTPPSAQDARYSIMPGTIRETLFAETLKPIRLSLSAPSLPDAAYPIGTVIYLTANEKLYKNVADMWVNMVNAPDMAGQIVASQITANTITAGQMAAGAIGTTELAAQVAVFGDYSNATDKVGTGATVVIDDTGIAISNGKLTLRDNYGSEVLTGAGFGASWDDFIGTNVYNSMFRAGSLATSLPDGYTSDLPYWSVMKSGATGDRVATDYHASPHCVRYKQSATSGYLRLSSAQFPVQPGQALRVGFTSRATTLVATNTYQVRAWVYFSDEYYTGGDPFWPGTHEVARSITATDTNAVLTKALVGHTGTAKSSFAQVFIEIVHTAGTSTTGVIEIGAVVATTETGGAGDWNAFKAGTDTVTGDGTAAKTLAVTFDTAFAGTPVIVASMATSTSLYYVTTSGASSSGFTLRVARLDGATFTAALACAWVAIYGASD